MAAVKHREKWMTLGMGTSDIPFLSGAPTA